MVHAVRVPRSRALAIAGAVGIVLVLIAIAVVVSTTKRPAAVLQVARRSNTGVTVTYLTSGARSVEIVERTANGSRISISGIASNEPQTLRRGPWQSASALPVQYDVVAKAAFGSQSTDSAKITGLLAVTPLPSGSSDKIGLVRTYYTYWNAKRFSDMWNLLSPNFKSKNNYNTWVSEHSYDKSITLSSARDAADGNVAVVVVAVDRDASGALQSHTYNLTWTLVQENGRWLLDSAQ